ncbi:hypothetical protein FOCC_FOCC015008, partial [Frankliniella occidentalis]
GEALAARRSARRPGVVAWRPPAPAPAPAPTRTPSMLQWVPLLLLTGVSLVGCMPRGGAGAIDGAPSNITVMFLSHTSVHVNWSTNMENVEKYDVTYKPTDASFKVVIVVAGNSESVVLDQLLPDTQYQMWVQAFRAGKRFRSRQIVFRTL